jgi:hypothetical protein
VAEFLEPPIPASGGPQPPPPGLAQRLVAKAGAVVYEGGNSMFDESVLVYIPSVPRKSFQPPKNLLELNIVDHVGRRLGWSTESTAKRKRWMANPVTIHDTAANEVLRLRVRTGLRFVVEVSGVASAQIRQTDRKTFVLRSGGEPYGRMEGSGLLGVNNTTMRLFDLNDDNVGVLHRLYEGGTLAGQTHYVLAMKPGLRSELRRLLVTAPLVTTLWNRQQVS